MSELNDLTQLEASILTTDIGKVLQIRYLLFFKKDHTLTALQKLRRF